MNNKTIFIIFFSFLFLFSIFIICENVTAETKSFNSGYDTTEFKNLFKDFVSWNLEYKRYSYSEWTNGNQYLTINKLWNETRQGYKFTLTLNVPINIYSARFTFACNRTVLDYIDKTNYDVWLHYSIDNIIHTVSFNFSDMMNIQGLIFTHGVLNNNFWFRFQKNNINAGTYIFDPSFTLVSTGRSVWSSGGVWATIRNAVSGTVYNTWLEGMTGYASSTYYCYRGYFVFDTSSIPDNSLILSVYLYSNYNYYGGNSVRFFYQDSNSGATVEGADYNKSKFGDYYGEFYNTGTGIKNTSLVTSCIDKTGYTTIVIRSDCDYNNTTPTNEHSIATNGFSTVKLFVVYTDQLPVIKVTNINSTSTSGYSWNNTGNYWFVNVTSTGNLTPITLINIIKNATGIHTFIKNNSGYFVTANYTGNGTSIIGISEDDFFISCSSVFLFSMVGMFIIARRKRKT